MRNLRKDEKNLRKNKDVTKIPIIGKVIDY